MAQNRCRERSSESNSERVQFLCNHTFESPHIIIFKIFPYLVNRILLFRSLEAPELCEVIDAMFLRKVEPGEIVIRQGDDGDFFYVISE